MCEKFYGQYNNIRTVLGYGSREMSVVHLCKVYCLPALMYGCESWHLQNKEQNRISVAWNNCFRSIFNCCWRESVNPLQYLNERRLLFWNKLFISDNYVLFSMSRLVSQRFVAVGCLYGLSSIHVSRQTIKQAVWDTFTSTVTSHVFLVLFLFFAFFVFSGCMHLCVCIQLYCSVLLPLWCNKT